MTSQPQTHEYQLANHQLSTPERVAKFNAELNDLPAEGWTIHTCDTSTHPDVQILWQREVTPWREQEAQPPPQEQSPAPVHQEQAERMPDDGPEPPDHP